VQKQLRTLPQGERADVVLKLIELGENFDQPHQHAGIGIRKLRADLFECRVGLGLRVLFRISPDALIIRFIGTHDEVQKHLRGR
jgi:mRNA-degrading endonuclease RelE of RelBE toxin-antitoxin system